MTDATPLQRGPSAGDWRGSAAAVAILTFDVVAEAPVMAEGGEHAADLSAMSHQAYGPRVGLPRILSLLSDLSLEGTFFVPGIVADLWPQTVESIAAAGHEIALQGNSHGRLVELSPNSQRADFERGLEALRRLGIEPRGYRAPYWQLTRPTLDLVAESGLLYDSSLMDDDRPYRLRSEAGILAELPVHWSLRDWEHYALLPDPQLGRRMATPDDLLATWLSELDGMRTTGSLCILTSHPYLSGRPSRLRILERFVQAARERGDVRFERADRIAEVVLGRSAVRAEGGEPA